MILNHLLTEKEKTVLRLIKRYAGFDGDHHKKWLLDQIVRELTGLWYDEWIAEYEKGPEGPETYKWDEGIAP